MTFENIHNRKRHINEHSHQNLKEQLKMRGKGNFSCPSDTHKHYDTDSHRWQPIFQIVFPGDFLPDRKRLQHSYGYFRNYGGYHSTNGLDPWNQRLDRT